MLEKMQEVAAGASRLLQPWLQFHVQQNQLWCVCVCTYIYIIHANQIVDQEFITLTR